MGDLCVLGAGKGEEVDLCEIEAARCVGVEGRELSADRDADQDVHHPVTIQIHNLEITRSNARGEDSARRE